LGLCKFVGSFQVFEAIWGAWLKSGGVLDHWDILPNVLCTALRGLGMLQGGKV
jgi:hypothetical protein